MSMIDRYQQACDLIEKLEWAGVQIKPDPEGFKLMGNADAVDDSLEDEISEYAPEIADILKMRLERLDGVILLDGPETCQ